MPCNLNVSPGPAYGLRTLTGYEGHDNTKHRGPAYSIGMRTWPKTGTTTPGPYRVENVHRFGKYHNKGWTIAGPGKSKPPGTDGPGAAGYHPRSKQDTPAYSFGLRCDRDGKQGGPGPAEYYPKYQRQGGWTIAGRAEPSGRYIIPGPGATSPLDLYKNKAPTYSLGLRLGAKDAETPGPGPAYLPKINTCAHPAKAWSFGLRHSDCAQPLVTYNDNNESYC